MPGWEVLKIIIKCAWCGKDMGEKPPLEDKSATHSICEGCREKYFGKKEAQCEVGKGKPTRKELNEFALKLVASMRGHSAGVIDIPQLRHWTKEELEGTASLMLEDLREDNPEALEELERLYMETCGQPFRRGVSRIDYR